MTGLAALVLLWPLARRGTGMTPQASDVAIYKDQLVEIDVNDIARQEPPPGSPAALLAAMGSSPHIPSEDVDELMRVIKNGRLRPDPRGVFDDLAGE